MAALITKTETYDVDMMAKLLQKDGIAQKDKALLKAYSKRRINGNTILVPYNFPSHYAGIQKGRVYPQPRIGIEAFPRDIRAALVGKYYWDIDMENAQPVLLLHLAKTLNVACPALTEFCEKRVEILKEIMTTHNLSRDEAKTICISVIFGGWRDHHPLLPLMYQELKTLGILVSNTNPELFAVAKKDKDFKDKHNPHGSCLAVYIQNEERILLQQIDKFITAKGRSLDAWIHDGGCLRKLPNEESLDPLFLREIETSIKELTGYTITLAVKPMTHTFVFKEEDHIYPHDAIIDDLFACKKLVEINPDKFLRDGQELFMTNPETGLWQPYSLEDAKKIVSDKKDALVFKQYTATGIHPHNYGGDLKKVQTMLAWLPQCVPSGQVPIEFLGSLGEQEGDPEKVKRVVELYDQLLSVISNNNKEKKDYLLKYLAHALQKPRDLPGVCLVVTGGQGCGKDTTFDIFMKYVIGNTYAKDYDKSSHFFNEYDSSKGRKVMVKLQEADAKACAENAHTLKSLITGATMNINPKLKKEYTIANYGRYIFTTNEGNPINLEGDDRRYVLYDCSMEKSKDKAFWVDVYATLLHEDAGRILYTYFMGIDLSGFDIRTFPISEYQKGVQDDWKTIEEMFIADWDGDEGSATDIYARYRSFCLRLKIREDTICNKNTFCKRLSSFCRDGKILRRLLHGATLYSKVDADPQIE
jgi:hypothetical protein